MVTFTQYANEARVTIEKETKYDYKATDCLQGCIARLTEGCPGIVTPINTESMAPWAEVEFEGQGVKITVGNKSAPNLQTISGVSHPNSAAIQSVETGLSSGLQCKVEIIDEQGGSFDMFFDKMVKCMSQSSASYQMNLRFGWVGTQCGQTRGSILKLPKEQWTLTYTPLKMDVNFTKGKVKYTITGADSAQLIFTGRETTAWGSDDQQLTLKDAIRQMFNTKEPKLEAKFLRRTKGGRTEEWDFPGENGTWFSKGEGPVGAWRCDNENKIVAANKWIVNAGMVTDRGKGVICSWQSISEDGKPTVIFWEDGQPDADEIADCSRSIGTFIVNGGKCSNVISFKPKINFAAQFQARLVGGGVGGGQTSKTIERDNTEGKGKKKKKVQMKSTGISGEITTSTTAQNAHGKQALEMKEKAQMAHSKSGTLQQVINAISAELVMVGNPDPVFVNTMLCKFKTVTIVVINPFSLGYAPSVFDGSTERLPNVNIGREILERRKYSSLCGDWLADPVCNELLSNKAWQIQGIHHSIKGGSYITTLNLFLAVVEGQHLGNDTLAWLRPPCPEGD